MTKPAKIQWLEGLNPVIGAGSFERLPMTPCG